MDAERTDTGRKQRLINPIIINSMIVAIATMRMDEDTTVQVHVPMDVEIMQVPPTNKEKLELVSELFKIPYLASPEEYGEAIAKAAREQYYR